VKRQKQKKEKEKMKKDDNIADELPKPSGNCSNRANFLLDSV
jgi:hypothetical protein